MCFEMLCLLLGMRFLGEMLMTSGLSGARVLRQVFLLLVVRLVAPLLLAALPFWEEACYVFVVGVLEAELLVAEVLVGCIGLVNVMRLMSSLLLSL